MTENAGVRKVREVGKAGFHRLRESIGDAVSDLTIDEGEDDFRTLSTIEHLGKAVAFDNRMSSMRLDRTVRHIARGGLDHYQVRLVFAGGFHSTCRRRSLELAPGSINICDMTEPERVEIARPARGGLSRTVVWYLPRTLLAPLLQRPDAVGSTLVRGSTPYGALLHSHLVALFRASPRLPAHERESALAASSALIAGAVGVGHDAIPLLSRAQRDVRLAAIKRYVRGHATSGDLRIEALAVRFAMSRSALCRLFEADGGVAHFVQRCRLDKAFGALSSSAPARARVIDVAFDCRFESESSFIRAFRRRFGITPGELRRMAEARRLQLVSEASSSSAVHGWLETLSGG